MAISIKENQSTFVFRISSIKSVYQLGSALKHNKREIQAELGVLGNINPKLMKDNYSLLENKPKDWQISVLDEMTLMKVLPRIEGDEDKTKLLDDLIILFQEKNLPKSLNKAKEMANRRRLSHYTSFWS